MQPEIVSSTLQEGEILAFCIQDVTVSPIIDEDLSLQQCQMEIDQIDIVSSHFRDALDILDSQRAQFTSRLHEMASGAALMSSNVCQVPATINQLPAEILLIIFAFAILFNFSPNPSDPFPFACHPAILQWMAPYNIALVCRRWRQRSLSFPQLWRRFVIPCHMPYNWDRRHITEIFFQRSSNEPLDLLLCSDNTGFRDSDYVFSDSNLAAQTEMEEHIQTTEYLSLIKMKRKRLLMQERGFSVDRDNVEQYPDSICDEQEQSSFMLDLFVAHCHRVQFLHVLGVVDTITTLPSHDLQKPLNFDKLTQLTLEESEINALNNVWRSDLSWMGRTSALQKLTYRGRGIRPLRRFNSNTLTELVSSNLGMLSIYSNLVDVTFHIDPIQPLSILTMLTEKHISSTTKSLSLYFDNVEAMEFSYTSTIFNRAIWCPNLSRLRLKCQAFSLWDDRILVRYESNHFSLTELSLIGFIFTHPRRQLSHLVQCLPALRKFQLLQWQRGDVILDSAAAMHNLLTMLQAVPQLDVDMLHGPYNWDWNPVTWYFKIKNSDSLVLSTHELNITFKVVEGWKFSKNRGWYQLTTEVEEIMKVCGRKGMDIRLYLKSLDNDMLERLF
ncbi:hypothetical protein C8J56DRAFT_1050348 [Mycena floridula]|nr:hypothetical protein C8J56DRAFT_1050348 [Mycena floridula]